jgi:hypothetical protein
MRRLITTFLLIITLPLAILAAVPEPKQAEPAPLYIRWDKQNRVLCYANTPAFDTFFSCVYIPRDGVEVQLNLPRPGESKT